MDHSSKEYKLATAYISSFKSLGPISSKAHNTRDEGIIHYFVKKRLNINVIRQMAYIVDRMYDNALLEDLETENTEGEDVFDELVTQENKKLKELFEELADHLNNKKEFEFL